MARHRSPRGRTASPRSAASSSPRRRTARAGDAVRSIPGPVRHGAAVALAAGGIVSVLGAAAPLAGPLVSGVDTAAAAFGVAGTSDTAAAGTSGPAVEPDAPVTGGAVVGGVLAGVPAGTGDAVAALPPAVSLTPLADAARSAGDRTVAEQQRVEQQAAEEARAAEERAKAALSGRTLRAGSGSTSCGMSTASLGAVKAWVADAAEFLGCQFGQPQLLGVGSRGNASDHPGGLALDLMTSNQVTGDSIAACALKNMDALGVTYVIWDRQINTGSGWEPMEDRGSPTANHEDHVHISFQSSAPGGTPVTC